MQVVLIWILVIGLPMANIVHRICDPFSLSTLTSSDKTSKQHNSRKQEQTLLRVKQESKKLSCEKQRNMKCFHCFLTKQTLTDLKVKALVKGSLSFFLEEIVSEKERKNRIC